MLCTYYLEGLLRQQLCGELASEQGNGDGRAMKNSARGSRRRSGFEGGLKTSRSDRLTRRSFQEALISLVVMLLLVGFLLQFWIYSEMGVWIQDRGRLGNFLGVAFAVALALCLLLLYRWRMLRRDLEWRQEMDDKLQVLKQAVETMEIGITITDNSGCIQYVNQAEAKMHGYEVDELIGKEARIFAPRELWRPMSLEELRALKRSQRESINVRADGSTFPAHLISNVVLGRDGEPFGLVTSCEDITERKRWEDELWESRKRLRELAHHEEEVREKERQRIANEIHNDIGAALTVLKLDLTILEQRLARDGFEDVERIHSMLESIDATIDMVRSVSRKLRPFLLDDVGLNAAIEWQIEEVEQRTGIRCSLTLPDEELDLPDEVKRGLYRVFQEAVTNCLRHAAASQLWVGLDCTDGQISMLVRDNGVGIRDEQVNTPTAFGLFAIRERIKLLGGEVTIQGIDGSGTILRATVPLQPVEALP